MTKNETITEINNSKSQILTMKNAHFANINNKKDVWWFTIPLTKFDNDLHLLLNKVNGFIWLKISANTFEEISNVFRIKQGKWVDFEISSNKRSYMKDVKSGGTKYDFKIHVKHEFNSSL